MTGLIQLRGSENANAIRYFSLGRHALLAGLRAIGVGAGQSVLLPEFICRDLLAAVRAVGAVPIFYPVGLNLRPTVPPEAWPDAVVVVAVNYFGFSQSLGCFRTYCERTGAVLIEDNAHGFLSRDETGCLLGFRGDLGLLSFRKTFLIPNGAALVVSDSGVVKHIEPQLNFSGGGGWAVRARGALRHLPVVGSIVTAAATHFARQVRLLRTGHALPPSRDDAETVIPTLPQPYSRLLTELARFDFSTEVTRRRTLYKEFSHLLREWEIEPVFPFLPENVSPYAFPFRAQQPIAEKVRQLALRRGLDAFRWPALPDSLELSAPDHYRRTWVINFL